MANIFINNQLNNLLTGGKTGGDNTNINQITQKVDANAAKLALSELKNMLVGDVFTGEVMGNKDGELLIKMGSSNILKANIAASGANLSKGDVVTFQIENKSEDKVVLKPLVQQAEQLSFANKALGAANLAITKENLSLVKNLVDMNMPINKQTLNEMSLMMSRFPESDINTLVRLYKLQIPITSENITEFEAYKNFENNISGEINNLANDITNVLEQYAATKGSDILAFNNELVNLLGGNSEALTTENFINILENNGSKEEFSQVLNLLTKNVLTENKNSTAITPEASNNLEKLISTVKENIASPNNALTVLNNIIKDNSFPDNITSKLLTMDSYKELVFNAMTEKFFIKPKDVANKEQVKEVYEKMLEFAKDGKAMLDKLGHGDSAAAKGMNAIKTSVEFMNELNHNLSFIQVPIKFSEQEKNGNLYVYSNKKGAHSQDDTITALLHLDMEYLGPMDVYVKMKNMSVSTNFCLESEEMLDFIYENIDILTKRLNEQGYDFNPTMTLKDDAKNIDFIKDFVDVEQPVIPVSRYLFDTKA